MERFRKTPKQLKQWRWNDIVWLRIPDLSGNNREGVATSGGYFERLHVEVKDSCVQSNDRSK